MHKFSQFNIKTNTRGFEGEKIKITKILNKEIIIHDFRIEDSKVFKDRGTCKCLHLQISINEEKHVLFTSSSGLIEAIIQVPKDSFPFTATIIQENERYRFT
ncbi:MAG TPA: hypothetical protein PL124_05420 [Candidatus Cloacimonadota bacterium]|nr:hypothetical protein [Candidatus Cloacimonadota bacterium]